MLMLMLSLVLMLVLMLVHTRTRTRMHLDPELLRDLRGIQLYRSLINFIWSSKHRRVQLRLSAGRDCPSAQLADGLGRRKGPSVEAAGRVENGDNSVIDLPAILRRRQMGDLRMMI